MAAKHKAPKICEAFRRTEMVDLHQPVRHGPRMIPHAESAIFASLGVRRLVKYGGDDERRDVPWADGGEVSQIDGCDGDDAEPLADFAGDRGVVA